MTAPSALPPDDPRRMLTIADPDSPALRHVCVASDTYTILVSGADTAGRHTLIDMHIPPGGGPPPHRHDFEETFTLLEGELEFHFRGQPVTAKAGTTVNIPANAVHFFTNVSGKPARMLCLCAPAGQDEFFLAIGDLVASRIAPPPTLTPADIAERERRSATLEAQYRTEVLPS